MKTTSTLQGRGFVWTVWGPGLETGSDRSMIFIKKQKDMNRKFSTFVRRSRATGVPDFIPAVLTIDWSDDPRIPPARLGCILSRNPVPKGALPAGMYAVSLVSYPDDGDPSGWPRRLSGDPLDENREFTVLLPTSLQSFAALHYGLRYEDSGVTWEENRDIPFLEAFRDAAGEE